MPDLSYLGVFRRRRTIAIGAATLALLTAAVNDLPAQAATIKTVAYAEASQTFRAGNTSAPVADRNDEWVVTHFTPVQWPVSPSTEVSSAFGWRSSPCYGCSNDHHGVDLIPGYGTLIHSIAEGVVVASITDGGLGEHVIVEHEIDGETVQSVYAHMVYGSKRVSVGDTVAMGEVLGAVGNTGASTGPHLHFEIRLDGIDSIDPIAWLAQHATEAFAG